MFPCSRFVPGFAVLASATKVCDRDDTARFQPDHKLRAVTRRLRDIEPTVTVKQRWICPVQHYVFAVSDEHRHQRAILTAVEDLRGFIRIHIGSDFGDLVNLARIVLERIPKNAWRRYI